MEKVGTFTYIGGSIKLNGDITCEGKKRTGKACGNINSLKTSGANKKSGAKSTVLVLEARFSAEVKSGLYGWVCENE